MADESTTAVDSTTDDALGSDDLTALVGRLARREVSPAELRLAALDRAAAVNGRLNAVASWAEGATADQPLASGGPPLSGIPTVVKDNEDLAGHVTTQGSWTMPDRPAADDSPFVAHYLRLGVVPIAKTTLSEFGLTATTETSRFGATRNPWDTGRSSGGSSGGSAALVAAGVVPIAHGNDGGGSIRIPAACCGLVGLKPSRGRLVDRRGLGLMPVRITTQGVLTRSVRDTALYYAQAERLHRDRDLPQIGFVAHPDPRRLRIGVVVEGVRELPLAPETVNAVRDAGLLCQALGHHVEQTALPVGEDFGPDFLRYWALLALSLTRGGRWLFGRGFDGTRAEPFTQGLAAFCRHRAERLPGSLQRLRRLAQDHEAVFERYDVLLSPVLAHPPPRIGHLGPDVDFRTHLLRLLRYSSFTPLQNVSGSPGLSLPLARAHTGLPIGIHLAAPYGHEARLLALAYELEDAAPWPTRPAGTVGGASPA